MSDVTAEETFECPGGWDMEQAVERASNQHVELLALFSGRVADVSALAQLARDRRTQKIEKQTAVSSYRSPRQLSEQPVSHVNLLRSHVLLFLEADCPLRPKLLAKDRLNWLRFL